VANHKNRPYVIGFAAETENLIANAKQKLQRKKLDMIIANDVSSTSDSETDIGFNSEYNALHVFWRHDQTSDEQPDEQYFEVARKSQLAKQLITLIAQQYNSHTIQHAKNTA